MIGNRVNASERVEASESVQVSENEEQKNPWSLATSGVDCRAVANRPLHPEAYWGRGIIISAMVSKLGNNGVLCSLRDIYFVFRGIIIRSRIGRNAICPYYYDCLSIFSDP